MSAAESPRIDGTDFFPREKAITSRRPDPAIHGEITFGFLQDTEREGPIMTVDEVKKFLARLLQEAPGCASDIATAIRMPSRLVELSLEELSNDGLAERVTDTSGTWYRWAADPMQRPRGF